MADMDLRVRIGWTSKGGKKDFLPEALSPSVIVRDHQSVGNAVVHVDNFALGELDNVCGNCSCIQSMLNLVKQLHLQNIFLVECFCQPRTVLATVDGRSLLAVDNVLEPKHLLLA